MQIKSVIIDNIYYINFIIFFFLICSAEIGMRFITPCVLYAVQYGKYKYWYLSPISLYKPLTEALLTHALYPYVNRYQLILG